jgi:hypothetical protein
MNFDSGGLPNMSTYIAKLPRGLSSYPDCQLRANIHEDILSDFPKLADEDRLPKPVRDYLNNPNTGDWLREVVGNALILAVRDTQFETDEAFLNWCRKNMSRLFAKPLYRIVMNLFSTSLLIMGATKRWDTFHMGSQLLAKPAKKINGRLQTIGILTYPQNLFSGLVVPQLGATYLAALDANKAEEPLVEVREHSLTESLFFVSWKA